jgi:hypothetical protein
MMTRSEIPLWVIAAIWFASTLTFGFGLAHGYFIPKWALTYLATVLASVAAFSLRRSRIRLPTPAWIFFVALAGFVALTSVRLFLLGFDG